MSFTKKSAVNAAKVATYMREHPTATNVEIADALQMKRSTAARYAKRVRERRGIPTKRGARPMAAKLHKLYKAIADVAEAAKALE